MAVALLLLSRHLVDTRAGNYETTVGSLLDLVADHRAAVVTLAADNTAPELAAVDTAMDFAAVARTVVAGKRFVVVVE